MELYTTQQIAEMYSGKEGNITSYMITQNWIPKGLKHIRGKGKGFLFKKEWIEEFLEMQTALCSYTTPDTEKMIISSTTKKNYKMVI